MRTGILPKNPKVKIMMLYNAMSQYDYFSPKNIKLKELCLLPYFFFWPIVIGKYESTFLYRVSVGPQKFFQFR